MLKRKKCGNSRVDENCKIEIPPHDSSELPYEKIYILTFLKVLRANFRELGH
jgi:hypothetical protein